MQKTKLSSRILTGVMLSLALFTLGGQVVQAAKRQRPVYLLRTKCVNSGLGNTRTNTREVSIGKAVYTSLFYQGPGSRSASVTCRIKQDDAQPVYQTLQLGFGMRDNERSSPPVNVNVYLDGRPTESRTVNSGQQATLSLDVSNVSNVSIETVCSSQSQICERVYFFNALLEPIPVTPTLNPSPSPSPSLYPPPPRQPGS